ncbi:SRPBCC family protein [Caulobacter zeae]|nr:SRPBCC family protein [Caulobacter zeae]
MEPKDEMAAPTYSRRATALRVGLALTAGLAFSLGVYLLAQATQPSGLVSFAFLLVLPAAVCAFIAYVADPWGRRSLGFYLMIPVWVLGAVIVLSIIVLREGTVCVVMLSPLWLGSGLIGAALAHKLRNRGKGATSRAVALAVLPLLAMQVEARLPVPEASTVVTRRIVVDAPPEVIWPLLEGVPDVRKGEGRWNLSQDVVGVPRPQGARLVGEGVGARRLARWEHGVAFDEVITEWEPGRRIAWRFVFDDLDAWDFTDRHLRPDSAYFKVTTGGYRLTPLADGRTEVALHTAYWMKTPVNGYSRLWGEVFLGDLENNLLALIKARAERAA